MTFTRNIFVTNSSSTCNIVYGIMLPGGGLDKLINLLYDQNKEAIDTELDAYWEEERPADVCDAIREMDDWEYLINDLLPAGINLVLGEGDEYLDFAGSLACDIIDNHVVLTDITPDHYSAMVLMAEKVGKKKPKPNLHCWSVYDE